MRTEKQIAASRANGARSRGPKSPRDADDPGNYKGLGRAIVFEGESRRGFEKLAFNLAGNLKPETHMEYLLVGKMAAAHWRQLRIWNLERKGDNSLADHEMRLDRQFYRTLTNYLKLRDARETFLRKRT